MTDPRNYELPEAPASVTYSITSKNGFNVLFTVRDGEGLSLLLQMSDIENILLELQYKPQLKPAFGKKEREYVDGKVCPKCGGRLEMKYTKRGKKYHKCENGKFDPVSRQPEGCPFVDWLDQSTSVYPYRQPNVNGEEWGV